MSFDLSGYVDVAERIRLFREKHPNGSLQPLDLTKPYDVVEVGEHMFIVYTAAAYREPTDPRPGIGVAWESFPGRNNFTRDSELMNAETSAWGRAIIATLAADTQKIASSEEVRNRQQQDNQTEGSVVAFVKPTRTVDESNTWQKQPKATINSVNITEAQIKLLGKLATEKNYDLLNFVKGSCGRQLDDIKTITKKEASTAISELMSAEPVI
jgi:hypothetical protein